jgi:hypothetical protein
MESLVDKDGNPDYSRTLCDEQCRKQDRREKQQAKRAKERREIERRLKTAIKHKCKGCQNVHDSEMVN